MASVFLHWFKPSPKEAVGIEDQFNLLIQLALDVWLTLCQGATEPADGQVAFMRQLHESSFRAAQCSGSGVEQSQSTADQPLNEATEAVSGIVRRPAFVGSHISSIFISSLLTKRPYSSLALCMNSELRRFGICIVLGKCHFAEPWKAALESMIFDLLINMQEVSFLAAQSPFSQPWLPSITVFHDVQPGTEASHTPSLSATQWGEEKGEKKILLGTSPNEQINASVPQGMQEWVGVYWDPEDQAKAFTQKQLPQSMNRSLFTLAQQYISLEPHWAEL